MKIVLGASFQQRNVLANAKKLKNSEKYSKIFIRPSLTPEGVDVDRRQSIVIAGIPESTEKFDYELRQAARKLRETDHENMKIFRMK